MRLKKEETKEENKTNVLLVSGNDVCDHPVRDARTDFLSQSYVAFELLDGQSLLRVLLVLLLQLQKIKKREIKHESGGRGGGLGLDV